MEKWYWRLQVSQGWNLNTLRKICRWILWSEEEVIQKDMSSYYNVLGIWGSVLESVLEYSEIDFYCRLPEVSEKIINLTKLYSSKSFVKILKIDITKRNLIPSLQSIFDFPYFFGNINFSRTNFILLQT